MLPLLLLLLPQDSLAARAESLIAAHQLPAARHIAERLVSAHPNDASAHLLLGRVFYLWPVVGRYAALAQFREAARLDPRNPEPLYWQVRVGQFLGSDEGEGIIREAILKIFELAPDYADCWALFTQLYQDDGSRGRADAAFARYPNDMVALERRARLAIELQEPDRADSLAALVLARRGRYLPGFLLRAEAAFDAGRDDRGYAWYDSALAAADADSTGALWSQVWMIASPRETARQDSLVPGERRSFFMDFWSRRDPDLVTPENERIAEHFRRLAQVRRMFPLLHPYARFQRSAATRALEATYLNDAVLAALESGVEPLDTMSPARLLLPDVREFNDSTAQLTSYARANLTAPGLVWLRHGRPDHWDRQQGWLTATHEWAYDTPDGPLTIEFSGIPGPSGAHGDYIVAPPMTRRRAWQVHELLTTDGTSLPATLSAQGWSAFFKSPTIGSTDLYVRTVPESAAIVLWDTAGAEVVRAAGAGILVVSAPPGLYDFGLDVDSGAHLGRVRQRLGLPRYSWVVLSLSSLALAPSDSLADREATLSAMPADLVFPAGRSLATYAEVYGLTRGTDVRARYHVRYTFTPVRAALGRLLGGSAPVVFEFDRDVEWRGATPERLVIEPGRLAPGRYRVTLSVTDVPTNVKSEAVTVEIRVR
jgi:hypothetical protein